VSEESEGTHQPTKEKLKDYTRKLRMILKSELSAKNRITAIEALAIPILRHSFCIINWRLKEIRKVDKKTRNILTVYKMHHPQADIEWL
jgi:hypothetical protein